MKDLQTVLDALTALTEQASEGSRPRTANIWGNGVIAIGLVKQMMQVEQQTISTEHGPWLESKHPGEEGESYCKRCLLRDKFLGARSCTPHIVEAAPQAVLAEPSCSECKAPHLLYECVHCSVSNYPATPAVKEYEMEPHDQNWIHSEDV